jgi:hydroxymethylpyrimidine/phosphomethylpyrimidine kinase
MTVKPAPPLVLCIAGHDPSGGAGIIADVQTVSALGCHPLSVITSLTVQDSRNVQAVEPVPAALIERQLKLLLDDSRIASIKIGLIGEPAQIPVIVKIIERAGVPVVLDPVLRAGGGGDLAGAAVMRALIDQLLPRVTVATPNAIEARRLAGSDDVETCAATLLALGCANLLITGGDEPTPSTVTNRWHSPQSPPMLWQWPRLPGGFHGAGCTLASAIAARLALGDPLELALENAQRWVHGALSGTYAIGQGRPIPNRLPEQP